MLHYLLEKIKAVFYSKETGEHIAIIEWFSYQYPHFSEDFHHFANQRKCSPSYGNMLKKMGVRKGVSDFHLAVACGGYHGLWLELKVDKGRLTKEQKEFLERKKRRGYFAASANGFEEAIDLIAGYLVKDNSVSSIFNPKICT